MTIIGPQLFNNKYYSCYVNSLKSAVLQVIDIKYITLSLYTLYLSPKRGFEHVTEYHPEAVAEGPFSVMCSDPSFGGKSIMRTVFT